MKTKSYTIDSKKYLFEQMTHESKQCEMILSAHTHNIMLWKIPIKDATIDDINGLYTIDNLLFCFIKNAIYKIDIKNGSIIKTDYFGNTTIESILLDKDCMYILLSHWDFDTEKYPSNALCVNIDLEIQWYAELPQTHDVYAQLKIDEYNRLVGYTWAPFWCVIHKDTGKLIESSFARDN